MGVLDLLGGQKPPQPAYQPPVVPPQDPTAFALEQFSKGKATPEQKSLVSKLPAATVAEARAKGDAAQLAQVQPGAGGATLQKMEDINVAKPKAQWQAPTQTYGTPQAKGMPNQPIGSPEDVFGKHETSPGGAMPVSVMPIAPKKITSVTDKGPEAVVEPPKVVSSAIVQQAAQKGPQAAQATVQAMDTPVTKEQASAATDAMDKFLKANPDGATLANILDAVGVALSAYGGTQRQTMLQQRKAAQLQLAQQQALNQQGYGQQEKMAGIGQANAKELKGLDYGQQLIMQQKDLDNQLALKQKEYELAVAKGDTSAAMLKNDLARIAAQRDANVAQQKAVYEYTNLTNFGPQGVQKAVQETLGG